jgi:hypothetical protein
MMQVEEKPDVTYSDVGGSKEQIEKLREVVEMPLLEVINSTFYVPGLIYFFFHMYVLGVGFLWFDIMRLPLLFSPSDL